MYNNFKTTPFVDYIAVSQQPKGITSLDWLEYKPKLVKKSNHGPDKTEASSASISHSEPLKPEVVNQHLNSTYSPVYTVHNNHQVPDVHNNKVNFIKTFLPIYQKVLKEQGISEQFAEALVAQAALESNWGYKPIGHHKTVTNNYIGVKVPSKLRGKGVGQSSKTHEEIDGKMVPITDEFMVFNSLEDMARHHVNLLSNKRYQAFSGSVDEFADRVKRGGYATASGYAQYLNKMIASVRNIDISKMQYGGLIKPNFIKRLEDPNRKNIFDWASGTTALYNSRGEFTNNVIDDLINSKYPSISTHKMSHEHTPDDTGRAIVYPEVQEISGKLVDFTRPPYHDWAGYDSALDRGDYLIMKDLEEARKWVESYKDRYKNLK